MQGFKQNCKENLQSFTLQKQIKSTRIHKKVALIIGQVFASTNFLGNQDTVYLTQETDNKCQ